ncbi:zinc-ribbon domain containing protein [Beggiatoa leptomitoformis]|uniref:Probable zinc-binding domain-containing protein n=1 Tax=Beggiatoa leptomitoformis TaxID=288004 RepID=A0A2N9YE22_9GAMM|nr:zinc-ribbon domain containing protein [Beggiatoa leptomitoformis]ALG68886.1 hypothetical protein AL038_15770 [Beggiatoa leptomitoformis]AUI68741.1 hypothetical protein BLE401_08490 [Beggiatoa leptomitoformis]
MKSNKQRRLEIKANRLKQAKKQQKKLIAIPVPLPKGAILANPQALAHNHTYGILPTYYLDRPFTCRDCGVVEVWTAKQQRWWYEIAKGNINSRAVRCSACRHKIREQKRLQREHMDEKSSNIKKQNC